MTSSSSHQQNLDSFLQKGTQGSKDDNTNMPHTEPAWKVELTKKVSSAKSIVDLKNVLMEVTDVMMDLYQENMKLKCEMKSLESNLQKNVERYDEEIARINSDVDQSAQYSELTSVMDKVDDLENRSRRNNVRFTGIPEGAEKEHGGAENFIEKFVKEKLKVEISSSSIQRAHRVNVGKNTNQPRPIVAHFWNYKEKENVIKAAPKQRPQMNGKDVFVNHDYSSIVMQKRKALLPVMNEKRKEGQRAWLQFDKLLYIEGDVLKALRVDAKVVRDRKKDNSGGN